MDIDKQRVYPRNIKWHYVNNHGNIETGYCTTKCNVGMKYCELAVTLSTSYKRLFTAYHVERAKYTFL